MLFSEVQQDNRKRQKIRPIQAQQDQWVSATSHFNDFMRLRGPGENSGVFAGPCFVQPHFLSSFCEVARRGVKSSVKVSKRMPPEEEAAWRQAERRGQGDEWLKER